MALPPHSTQPLTGGAPLPSGPLPTPQMNLPTPQMGGLPPNLRSNPTFSINPIVSSPAFEGAAKTQFAPRHEPGRDYLAIKDDLLTAQQQKQKEEYAAHLADMVMGTIGGSGEVGPEIKNILKAGLDEGKKIITEFHPPATSAGHDPEIIQTAIQKLTSALQEAKPIRAKQEAGYSAERSQRLAKSQAVQSETAGEAGFLKEKAQLAGELPKPQFESLRGKLAQEDIDSLFNAVTQSNKLGGFDKIQAREGLLKMFGKEGGSVPTQKELKLLSNIFPPDTIQALQDARPFLSRIGSGIEQALNLPRSLLSSFDLSAPFRQGLFLIGKPVQFGKAFVKMFGQFASEKSFQAAQEAIKARPTYGLMRDAKLAIMDMDGFVSSREEKFMSNMAERIPVLGRAVRASGRAYTGFLNQLRADVFDSMLKGARDLGLDNKVVVDDIARFVNSASGRGSLGALERAAPTLNGIFFSPRLMASRINLLNPVYYAKLDPYVRKQALKTMLTSGAMISSIVGLAAAGGAKVETDPTSADFAKIHVGNTRFDVAGGIQQYLRLGAQLVSGKIKSSTTGKDIILGEGYKPLTRLDILERFFQGKENPVASFVTDWLQGQDAIGNKFNLTQEVVDRFIPLIAQDLVDALKEWGPVGALTAIPAALGVGVQTYGDKQGGLPGHATTKSKSLPSHPTI